MRSDEGAADVVRAIGECTGTLVRDVEWRLGHGGTQLR
jgi:hypothetical protein